MTLFEGGGPTQDIKVTFWMKTSTDKQFYPFTEIIWAALQDL
jgi:hypothetical protein